MKLASVLVLLLLALLAISAAANPAGTAAAAANSNNAEVAALKSEIAKLNKELAATKSNLASIEEQVMTRVRKEMDERDVMKAMCEKSKQLWEQTQATVMYWAKHGHAEVAKRWPAIRDQTVAQSKVVFAEAKHQLIKVSNLLKKEAIKLGLQDFHAEIAVGVSLGLAGLIATFVVLTLVRLAFRIVFYFLCCRMCRSAPKRPAAAPAPAAQKPAGKAPAASPAKVKAERK